MFGSKLSQELVLTNVGARSLRFEEALHTYLKIGHVDKARVQGLTSNVCDFAVELAPGQQHRMKAIVSVAVLDLSSNCGLASIVFPMAREGIEYAFSKASLKTSCRRTEPGFT